MSLRPGWRSIAIRPRRRSDRSEKWCGAMPAGVAGWGSVESVPLILRGELAFVTAVLTHRDMTVTVPDVLIDTGAASTVSNADIAEEPGIVARNADRLRVLRGVGGREYVFVQRIDRLAISSHGLDGFEIESGEIDRKR